MARSLAFAALAALVAAPLAAEAQSFRCVGKDGKKYYGSTVPRECIGQPIEQLNAQGLVIKRINPQATEEERAAKEAEAAKRREQELASREEARRNRALLATYTSVQDIEDARARALAENEKAIKDVETRISQVKKRQAGFQKELEFHKGKKPPQKLQDDIAEADAEMKAQENLLAVKKRDVNAINERYDDDKKRYLELTKGR